MRLFAVSCALAAFGLSATTYAADGEENPKFRIGHHILSHTSSQIEAKPSGAASAKHGETSMDTFAGGWEFYAFKAPYNIYLFPGQKNSSVAAGYNVTPEIEVGLTLNLQMSSRDKADATAPKYNETTTLAGIYGIYYLNIGTSSVMEFTLNPVFGSKTGESTDLAGVKTKVDNRITQINLNVVYDYALTANLHTYAQILYTSNLDDDQAAKVKTTTNTMTVTPIGFRYYI